MHITYEHVIKDLEKLPPREKQSRDQRKFFSEISEALMTRHLEHLIAKREWFAGILTSTSMLEYVGKTKLIWRQARISQDEVRKINKLSLAATSKKLLQNNMIDKPTYKKMDKIRIVRNETAHDMLYQIAPRWKTSRI